jgi:hypothetical protein
LILQPDARPILDSNEPLTIQANSPAKVPSGPGEPRPPVAKPSKSFEFITSKDEASRRKARAHVMRDYVNRKRRGDGIAGTGANENQASPGVKMRFKWKAELSMKKSAPRSRSAGSQSQSSTEEARLEPVSSGDATEDSRAATQNLQPPELGQGLTLAQRHQAWIRNQEAFLARESLDPLTPLGAGNVDPFNSYPLPVTLADQHLVHHCKFLFEMGALMARLELLSTSI